MSKSRDDIELMAYLDGELGPEESAEIARELDRDDQARAKVQCLEQVGEGVRTYLELAADAAEPRFAAMWSNIEKRIESNGVGANVERPIADTDEHEERGLLSMIADWFHAYRGHVFTGAVTAAAAAIVIVIAMPPQRVVERVVHVPGVAPSATALVGDVRSAPAVVEYLNVVDGTAAVLNMPGDDEGDSATTIIWIDPNEDVVEGPI